jgi:YggT family protein
MFILANFFRSLANMLDMIFDILYLLLVIRIILSWVNPDPFNQFVQIIYRITDPILMPIRRWIPLQIGMIDFSPIIAFILLAFLKSFIVGTLISISNRI